MVWTVLILVLVEDGFGVLRHTDDTSVIVGRLNPCFSGRWFRRFNHLVSIEFTDKS